MSQGSKFSVGQVVKHFSCGISTKTIVPVVVSRIWKNGVIEVADYITKQPYIKTFAPDGTRRGRSGWSSWSYIEPLGEGETAESLLAANEAEAQANRKAAQKARRERDEAIDNWWDAEGKAMWDARVDIPDFMGGKVSIVRYTRHNEQYMPFVVVGSRQTFDHEEEVMLTVGGLTGRTYNLNEGKTNDKGEIHTEISTFSHSTIHGRTLKEALYEMVH
jgi:hypothetical protein